MHSYGRNESLLALLRHVGIISCSSSLAEPSSTKLLSSAIAVGAGDGDGGDASSCVRPGRSGVAATSVCAWDPQRLAWPLRLCAGRTAVESAGPPTLPVLVLRTSLRPMSICRVATAAFGAVRVLELRSASSAAESGLSRGRRGTCGAEDTRSRRMRRTGDASASGTKHLARSCAHWRGSTC